MSPGKINPKKGPKPSAQPPAPKVPRAVLWIFVGVLLVAYLYRLGQTVEGAPTQIDYGQFYQIVEKNSHNPVLRTATKTDHKIIGEQFDGTRYFVHIPDNDQDLLRSLRENVQEFKVEPARTMWVNAFFQLVGPLLLLVLFWFLLFRGAQGGAGGSGRIFSFGRSKAKQVAEGDIKVTFKDVAGVDEAKEELQEIIEYLKEPKRFQKLGGKIPKGVLLMGPPGSGKTLLAKAVAGEADVPFFTISGSDFVEMFVGVGASRVRDLFEQAKKSAKTSERGAIIFIDEIDAVGRQRFAGIGGGHDEREQTLNALLVEMDGFNTTEAVILISATNRPDVLDPALLRPGRFDRQVVVSAPDIVGREAILKVHVKKIKLDPSVDLKKLARQTPGFSGADLANLANEAALLAARDNKKAVTMKELESSIERVMAGTERKSRVISKKEKKTVACHESGHALVALYVPETDPLHKVSIIPRGTAALGYTLQMPLEDRYIVSKDELVGRLKVLMGGRVAEELTFNQVTTGAQNDLQVATDIARRMVCEYGMSEKLGHLTFGKRHEMVFLGRDLGEERNYSDETAEAIDAEVKQIVDSCYDAAKVILEQHRAELDKLSATLLEKEVLDGKEVKKIVGIKETSDDSNNGSEQSTS